MRLVHHDQIPARQPGPVRPLQGAEPEEAYVANTVTFSNGRTQSTSSPTAVVSGKAASAPRRDDTPTTGPVRPAARHAASVWASRSSDGTSTSTRPARSLSALRAATRVFPDPSS